MKLTIGDEINIYLNKLYLNKNNINYKTSIKQIIKKINNDYKIDLYGYIEGKIYIDKNYGIIITLKKNELEYFDYFKDEIEINIEINEDTFLYKINDLREANKNCKIYKYKDELYLYINEINDINLGKIIENSEIIYGEKAKKIISQNNIISLEVIK